MKLPLHINLLLSTIFLLCSSNVFAQAEEAREVVSLNRGWLFHLGVASPSITVSQAEKDGCALGITFISLSPTTIDFATAKVLSNDSLSVLYSSTIRSNIIEEVREGRSGKKACAIGDNCIVIPLTFLNFSSTVNPELRAFCRRASDNSLINSCLRPGDFSISQKVSIKRAVSY